MPALAGLIRARAQDYYGADRDCPAWEPGGDDFLSSALTEALLMRRALPERTFRRLVRRFPAATRATGQPASLFTPAFVSDRSDGKIAHLDGVNLSRAWCWRGLAGALDPGAGRACAGGGGRPSRCQPAARGGRLYGRALAGDLRLARARRR